MSEDYIQLIDRETGKPIKRKGPAFHFSMKKEEMASRRNRRYPLFFQRFTDEELIELVERQKRKHLISSYKKEMKKRFIPYDINEVGEEYMQLLS